MELDSEIAFRAGMLLMVAEIVVCVWMVAAWTSFWTAVVRAAAFGRLLKTTAWPVVPTGIVMDVLAALVETG